MGFIDGNPRRHAIDEVSDIVGLDMKIDALVNNWGDTAALFAGKPQPTYAAALVEAKKHYLTPISKGNDIVIANTYAKANEAVSGLPIAFAAVKETGGDVVLIANAPDGQATHYLMGPFGNSIAGKLRLQMKVPSNVKRLIILNEYPELASRLFIEETDRVVMVDNWAEVLKLLKQNNSNQAKVAVYPNADIQYT
jgi:hypothetical protein